MKVKLSSARVGHNFDSNKRFTGQFAQAAGDIVDMPTDEARRYIERGLASEVNDNQQKKG
jgi:hypothetical protein